MNVSNISGFFLIIVIKKQDTKYEQIKNINHTKYEHQNRMKQLNGEIRGRRENAPICDDLHM